MAGNSNLASAMGAKQDEFYTQLRTIEDELRHYRKHFKGKTSFATATTLSSRTSSSTSPSTSTSSVSRNS